MNTRTRYASSLFGILLLMAAAISCRFNVPIRQMMEAKTTISRAVEVRAERYAPAELEKARTLLKDSHTEVAEGSLIEAENLAVKSAAEAQKAIDASLPHLSADSLEDAKKIFAEADLLYASKHSGISFAKADGLLKEAEALHAGKDYWNSHLKSAEAKANAEDARANSQRHVPALREEINSIGREADELKSKRGAEFASGEIASVKGKLEQARRKADESNLKEATPLVNEAKAVLFTARENTLRGISFEKLAETEAALKRVRESSVKGPFEGDISKASDLAAGAKALHNSKSYADSVRKSDEAMALLNTVSVSMTNRENELKAEALDKLAKAKEGLEEVNKSDLRLRHEADLGKAAAHVEAGGKLYEEKDYNGSILQSVSALAILEGVMGSGGVTGEAGEIGKAGETSETGGIGKAGESGARTLKYGEEPATYVVKYNPRDRDCLWKIAMYTYRNARLWPLIYAANRDKIRDPDLIFPGQNLVIPVIPVRQSKIVEEGPAGERSKQSAEEDKKKSTPAPETKGGGSTPGAPTSSR